MIIDVTRSLNDIEYERYMDIFERYHESKIVSYNSNTIEEANQLCNEIISEKEIEYIKSFDKKAQILIDHFNYERKWEQWTEYVIPLSTQNWLNNRNINFVIIKKPIEGFEYLFIKNYNDFLLFLIKMNTSRFFSYLYEFSKKLKWIEYDYNDISQVRFGFNKVEQWCYQNCEGLYIIRDKSIVFELETDLCAFLIVWK